MFIKLDFAQRLFRNALFFYALRKQFGLATIWGDRDGGFRLRTQDPLIHSGEAGWPDWQACWLARLADLAWVVYLAWLLGLAAGPGWPCWLAWLAGLAGWAGCLAWLAGQPAGAGEARPCQNRIRAY